jgi:hypothetical protein
MCLLTASQSHLTAYEEKRTKERTAAHELSYATLSQGEVGKGSGYLRQAQTSEGEAHLLMEHSKDIIGDIIRLAKVHKSPQGKPYRSLICALSRNDVHLREYVVRNLLAGFAHVVIYDNNQVRGLSPCPRTTLETAAAYNAVTVSVRD